MKKIFAIVMMLLAVSVSADAASKMKLYVNPGHGGYGDNDRQTAMPAVNGVKFTETKGCFWESEGNTYRAWGIEYFWKKRVNGNVKLSRYENSEAGDKKLSVIVKESNEYGGYFMSLHTNAGNASANYMIIMCNAVSNSNTSAKNSTSLKMTKDAAYWQGGEATAGLSSLGLSGGKANFMTQKSSSTTKDRGTTDLAFYGTYRLGVLCGNNAPGYLAESWFHDYRPEAFRLMSVGYNYFLAWQLMRAYLDSPGIEGVNMYPIIFGDIRDTSKGRGYTSYAARNRDASLAINGAKVTLRNVANGGTKTYTTDKFNNGFYTFYDCVPGATYEVIVEKDGKYMKKTITVGNDSKGTQHKLNFNWEDAITGTATPTVSLTASTSSVSFDNVYPNEPKTETVKVTGTGLSSDIAVTLSGNAAFTVSATSMAKTGGDLAITYSPTAIGTHTATVTLKSGTYSKTINVTGVCKNKPILFDPGWAASETDLGTAWKKVESTVWNKQNIRNMCYGGGKLYLVSPDDKQIYIINARTGEDLGTLNKQDASGNTVVTGGVLELMDVKYVAGKIVATSIANGDGNKLKVYVWDNDKAYPKCILNTTMPSGYNRVGDTFYVKGDLNNGGIYYAGQTNNYETVGTEKRYYNNILCYSIVNGVVNTTPSEIVIGNGEIALGASPRVIAETSGKFWVNGSYISPTLLNADGTISSSVGAEAFREGKLGSGNQNANLYSNKWGNAFKAFTFKGITYGMATYYPDCNVKDYLSGNTTAYDAQYGRAALFDASNGWADAEPIYGEWTYNAYPWKGIGTTSNWAKSSAIEVAVNGDKGVEAWILIYKQGLVYIKYGTVPSSEVEEVKVPAVTVNKTSISMEAVANEYTSTTVSVAGENLSGNIELGITGAGAEAFSLSQYTVETAGDVEVTFSPNKAGTYKAVLTVSSEGAESKTVELEGVASVNLNELGELEEGWNYSVASNSIPEWIVNNPLINNDGSQVVQTAAVRSVAFANNNLYILQNKGLGDAIVDIVDAYSGQPKGELNLNGVTEGIVSLSSLVAAGNVLLGSNVGLCETEATTRKANEPDNERMQNTDLLTLRVYKWTSETAAPVQIIEDRVHANMSTGAKISFSGDMTNGRIWFTNNEENAVLYYEIKNGVVAQTPVVINLISGGALFHSAGKETSAWGSGSVFYNDFDGSILVDFKDDLPTIFAAPVEVDGKLTASESVHIPYGVLGGSRFGSDSKIFYYNDKRYVVSTTYRGADTRAYAEDGTTVTSGSDDRLRHGAFALADITDGIENVTSNMGIYPSEGLGNWKNDHFNTTLCVDVRENGVDIWVCSYTQGVAYYYYGVDGATGIESVEVEEAEATAEYYNLQGIKVVNPSNGLFIKKQGNKITKVIL